MGKLVDPFIIFVAGPNGSGKTTMINTLQTHFEKPIEYLCPDDIEKKIKDLYHDPVECSIIAREITVELKQKLVENQESFILESVGSHPSHAEFLEDAKENGYTISTIFITTENPDINVERVAHRVETGGHNVPKDKIYLRYEKTMENIINYIEVSDCILILDNSNEHYEAVFLKSDDRITVLVEKEWVKEYIENKLDDLEIDYEVKSFDEFDYDDFEKSELLDIFDEYRNRDDEQPYDPYDSYDSFE